ncbi:3-oxoacyl-[acyl-carrier-protein] synthase III C-terminal domain-containing protein [Microbulbifer sp.]|uniref:3-oxoacyl-[acyl-carrier-protein] synthase III C-terminal domain-containing protein n=1 Tax=Microbulbifer sp. TaxID=1908541 RepID=UPI003F2AE627
MQDVFITGTGSFLPGAPVDNGSMEERIGLLSEHSRKLKAASLRQNGIKSRHYAIDAGGNYLFTNAEMAAQAILSACDLARLDPRRIGYLATSTTQGDLLVPGHASAVHAGLGAGPMEVSSHQSVCGSSMMAIKSSYLNIRAGEHDTAVACGSEFSSRWFQPGFYSAIDFAGLSAEEALQYEFLRWTLSDGAAALVMESRADDSRPRLRIDWIEQKSFADRFPNCMYAGSRTADPGQFKPWAHYGAPAEACADGAVALRQDFDLLQQMFPVWMGYFLEVLDKRRLSPEDVRHFLPHYSARSLGNRMKTLLTRSGAMIPEERWFNNQHRVGNVGSASIFLMIDQLMREAALQPGDRVLCFVPESGRCLAAFMCMTVV